MTNRRHFILGLAAAGITGSVGANTPPVIEVYLNPG